ncbi:MAG: family 20 glycosylhydrolase [Bacteroidaceae bacterium]
MKKQTLLIGSLLLCTAMPIQSKIEHLLPLPKTLAAHATEAPFALNRSIRVAGTLGAQKVTNFIQQQGGTVSTDAAAPVIEIEKVATIAGARILEEAYTLTVASNLIKIEATAELGVIRALQTLTQLAEGYEGDAQVEALTLTDYPAFAVRGFMHDVGRGFVSMEELKKEINLLARFKVNVFHWHLTDYQGWRIESKLYPVLTQKSFSRLEGKFYTQAEAKELVDYCMERGVKVIPEIDMPGHSASFERALGYSMQSAEGVKTLVAILNEMCTTVFDKCETFHIGTDEVNISNPTFVSTMVSTVRGCGKKAMSWRPGASYADGAIDMVQLWGTRGKVFKGIPNIDCRYMYSNHYDTYADVVGMYKTNIYYSQTGTNDIAGSIMAMWNDRAVATEKDVVTQNGLYASVIALAERTWKGGGKQYIETGGVMLPSSDTDEFKEFADWERRFLFHKENSMKDAPIPYVKQTNVRWRITDPFPNNGNKSATFPPETEELKDSYTYEGHSYGTQRVTGAGIYLNHTWGDVVPALFKNVSNSTAYAYTYVYSPTEQTVGAQIEFHNYGRSENDPAPAQGSWDDNGSKVWVNDKEIAPPRWLNTGGANSELTLKNENMSARPPMPILLKEGWNKVFLKLPKTPADRARLKKWMFTFVFTNVAGTKEASDLIYSPDKYKDDATESLSEVISKAKSSRNSKVGTSIGKYVEAAAADLDQVLATVEATLSDETVAPETRATQSKTVQDALAAFEKNYTTFPTNKPLISDNNNLYRYTMYTPLRGNRYPTSKGVGEGIVGETSLSDAAYWKFQTRTDGTLDIVNCADKSYISPNSANDKPLKTMATSPNTGWELKPAATSGCVIVVNGNVQFNQTNNSAQGFFVYNWGGGSNISDTGCQYVFELMENPSNIFDVSKLKEGTIQLFGKQLTLKDSETSRSVSIYNAASHKMFAIQNTTATAFDLSKMVSGIYIVKVITSAGKNYGKKIEL